MNADQREAVRSNAKYLRQVRPIDPEEIHEYVDGQPHPAAVAQVLRESAVDLGLVERADGTFEPVEEGSLSVSFHGVDAFPVEYGRVLEDRLVAEYGPGWPDGDSGDRLRERIRSFKEDYFEQRAVEYDAETALAYGLYHLPDYYAVAQYVLADLARDGLVPKRLRVLDVGAGVGGPALGLHDLVPADALVDYHAVEPSAAADVLDAMLGETGRNFHHAVHRETAEAFDPETALPEPTDADGADGDDRRGFDLILFSNVLSELDDPESVIRRYADALAEDGTIVGLAPADRNTAIGLRTVERAVADSGPLTIYGPDVRLWPGQSPADDCWSFEVKPDVEVPVFQRRLDDGEPGESGIEGPERRDGEFENADVQYAYTYLRRDGRRRVDFTPDDSRVAKLADSEDLVTERVNYYLAKLSRDLSDDGHPLFRVGDGSQQVDHFAVLTDKSMLNSDLLTAEYGDVLSVENALVLWNDDEGAVNLVIDGEAVVDRVPI
ncbi:methyltransferase type 12 [Halosimplex carlsbadense 2-9-1]|uniref:Methyltransferase type 12 n=1 Tax=Halosimplex carlsbadense 2-9-1 TaxID=797114 RepID=M0CM14_9EURY|nr:class I SAM-dependent methyltransferase [Halosimplex carlsbadense]ELZ24291.1 methyltransferase type 12 [Halosimplex carlsbadense 2-9-1]